MNILFKTGSIEKQAYQCLILLTHSKNKNPAYDAVDKVSKQRLEKFKKKGDIQSKLGHSLVVYDLLGVKADRVVLVSQGDKKEMLNSRTALKLIEAIAQSITKLEVSNACISVDGLNCGGFSTEWFIRQLAIGLKVANYRFNQYKSEVKKSEVLLSEATIFLSDKVNQLEKTAAQEGLSIGLGVNLARDLGNLPGNVCTPNYLVKAAQVLARKNSKVTTKILREKDMEKLKMGSFLSVSKGSTEEGALIIMHYKGGKTSQKPVILLGKGITFDSGGISLKPDT